MEDPAGHKYEKHGEIIQNECCLHSLGLQYDALTGVPYILREFVSSSWSLHLEKFEGSLFNGYLGSWDTSKVISMSHMFYRGQFNSYINRWNGE
jgi:hypothetical protein